MSERFTTPCPPPSAFEAELLECLIEECAEVIQRATKILRFGVSEIEPDQTLDNKHRLSVELGDLAEVTDWVLNAGLASEAVLNAQLPIKRAKLMKYLQHRPDNDVQAR